MERELSGFVYNPANLDTLDVGTIEDWISKEPYNQVLYLLLRYKMANYTADHFHFGIHNSLTPFLFDSHYILNNYSQVEIDISDKETKHVFSYERKTMENIHHTIELGMASENNEKQLHTEDNNLMLSEPFKSLEGQNSSEETIQPESKAKKDIASVRSKKNKKNKKSEVLGGNSFTDWLQNQKPIYSSRTKKEKKVDPVLISAKKSITPSDEIISEPLAKILCTQGHYLEAKLMYKKLTIKFPDLTEKYVKEINEINEKLTSKG
ncbi:MAG: hypothetical protein IPF52_07335 [Saprospiraceae bacterium]|nr:hypothetical protein [Saprospiraceae bacterium]